MPIKMEIKGSLEGLTKLVTGHSEAKTSSSNSLTFF
jgi:hypothetical protein